MLELQDVYKHIKRIIRSQLAESNEVVEVSQTLT